MAGNAQSWQITGQREDYRPGPTGAFVSGVVVTFSIPSGASGSVFVPDAQYSPASVRALVDARAAAMEAVAGMTGG